MCDALFALLNLTSGITPEFLREEADRAERWRHKLTLESQDIARGKLELEARLEQIQGLSESLKQQEKELEQRENELKAREERLKVSQDESPGMCSARSMYPGSAVEHVPRQSRGNEEGHRIRTTHRTSV